MAQGISDPVIVVIKLRADEDMVTYLRVKLSESGRKTRGKGPDMLTRRSLTLQTIALRFEEKKNLVRRSIVILMENLVI